MYSENKEQFEYEYVKKWVNMSEKFGVGFILNSGIIGILFNDKSKIILSNFGITFHYIGYKESSHSTYTLFNHPKELSKKVSILNYFVETLKKK